MNKDYGTQHFLSDAPGPEFTINRKPQCDDCIKQQRYFVNQLAIEQQRIIRNWTRHHQAMIHKWTDRQEKMVKSVEYHTRITNWANLGFTAVLSLSVLILAGALIFNIMMPSKYALAPTPQYKALQNEITRQQIRKELHIAPKPNAHVVPDIQHDEKGK
jgi:hypothetical protein